MYITILFYFLNERKKKNAGLLSLRFTMCPNILQCTSIADVFP